MTQAKEIVLFLFISLLYATRRLYQSEFYYVDSSLLRARSFSCFVILILRYPLSQTMSIGSKEPVTYWLYNFMISFFTWK